MWPSSLDINVSRESMEKLELYHALLLKWQKAINLVSPKTIDEAWVRHFADSAQVERYVPKGVKVVADLGSGGGFAGMVLAIMRPELEFNFIESDERKCQFLRTVSRETNTPITVYTQRIEAPIEGFMPDFVTARALADLPTLLGFVANWAQDNPALECAFLKGARADDEVEDAKQRFAFDVESRQSLTDPLARILSIKNISPKS